MIQKYSMYLILEAFFDNPTKVFMGRELCRVVKLSQSSVMLHLKSLLKEGLVLRSKQGLYGGYIANRDSSLFKILKTQNVVFRVNNSGLVDFLVKEIQPECIVMFGSGSRGEDIENSDVDIFIEAKECNLNVSLFEKKIHRKIHILFKERFKGMNPEIKNNVINGIKLYGYIKGF